MHEEKWSRAKADADKRRTGGSTFRAAISNARNERTSPLWARAALLEHAAAPGQARAALVEHSVAQARAAPVEQFADPGEARAAPVECSAPPGQARAAPVKHSAAHFSSILRLRGGLERPCRAIFGFGAGSSSHFERSAAPGQARAAKCSQMQQIATFRARQAKP